VSYGRFMILFDLGGGLCTCIIKYLVKNQIEKINKVLRMDNGGEFCINEFKELCKKCGISRKNTTQYTSQQNGFA
jgi:hypothetical protein